MGDQPTVTEDVTPLAGSVVPIETKSAGVTSGATTSQEKPSAASSAALADLTQADKDADAAWQLVQPAKSAEQTQVADQQGTEADRLAAASVDAAADNQSYLDRIHAAQQLQHEDGEALKDYKFHDFFHDADGKREVGRSLLTGIGSLFGSLSSAPGAAKAVGEQQDRNITRDFDLQRQEYSKLIEQRKNSGEDVNALYSEWEHKNAASLYKESLARQAAASRAVEIATRSGIPVSEAENSVFVKEQKAKAAQALLESTSRYDKHAQSSKQATSNTSTVTGKVTGNPEASVIRDPDTGAATHMAAGGPRQAAKVNTDNRNLKIAEDKMNAWIKFRTDNPGRLNPGSAEGKQAKALYEDMLGANISTTTTPQNTEAMDLEKGQLGESGVMDSLGSAWKGDNLEAVKNRLAEVQKQRQLLLNQQDPLPPGYVDRRTTLTAPAAEGPLTPEPKPTPAPPLSPGQQAMAKAGWKLGQ